MAEVKLKPRLHMRGRAGDAYRMRQRWRAMGGEGYNIASLHEEHKRAVYATYREPTPLWWWVDGDHEGPRSGSYAAAVAHDGANAPVADAVGMVLEVV